MTTTPNLTIVKKHGEVTGQELFKVRGTNIWHSSPHIAIRCFEAEQKFWSAYFGEQNNAGTKSKKCE